MWESTKNYEFYSPDVITPKEKIFFVDVDGTIVTPISGRPSYAIKSPDDWIFINSNVVKTLQKLSKTFHVVLISNQSKFNNIIKEKFEMIISALQAEGVDVIVYILKSQAWKKPAVRCYDHLQEHLEITPTEIRVTGDACNEVSDFPSHLWDNCDYGFYENLDFTNKKFYIPEKIFVPVKIVIPEGKNLILMVGNPGSGKTTFTQTLENYHIISGDKGMTAIKQLKVFTKYLLEEKNIVIDNLNATKQARMKFIEPAQEMGYTIIIVWCVRDGRPFNDLREKRIPSVVYHKYSKNFERPDEGLVIIV